MKYKILNLLKKIRYSGLLGFYLAYGIVKLYEYYKRIFFTDKSFLEYKFRKFHGYPLNLSKPTSFNEKLQWLKLFDRRPINTILADKYLVRAFIQNEFGEQYLIPIVQIARSSKEITSENLPDYPIIIKGTHNCGANLIVRDKSKLDWKKAKVDFRWWLAFNFFYSSREFQYKNMIPGLIVEKLLLKADGKIPNDYKVNCFNGKVEFIYVSIDREGQNCRKIYNINWEEIEFAILQMDKVKKGQPLIDKHCQVEKPETLPLMIEFAEKIGKQYPYIRVDFYDVDGKLYFGEITHHHGGGFYQFYPREYDAYYGEKMDLGIIETFNNEINKLS